MPEFKLRLSRTRTVDDEAEITVEADDLETAKEEAEAEEVSDIVWTEIESHTDHIEAEEI